MLREIQVVATAVLLSLASVAAHAQVTLTYTGNNFTSVTVVGLASGGTPPVLYTTSDNLDIIIEIAAPLGANRPLSDVTPIAMTATDGILTRTLANSLPPTIRISTDAAGEISAWEVRIEAPGPFVTHRIESMSNAALSDDLAVDQLCGPASSSTSCTVVALPSHIQNARVINVPGSWVINPPPDAPPTADAGDDQSVRALGETVTLDGSDSFDDVTPSGDLLFAWEFTSVPPGSAAMLADADTAAPSFIADVSGLFEIEVTVTDGLGQTATDTVKVSSENLAPTAEAGEAQAVPVGALVTLDGSGSMDPEGDPLTYDWAITDRPAGSTAPLMDTSLVNPFFQPDAVGTYEVTLTVSDLTGPGDPDTVEVMAIDPSDYASMKLAEAVAGLRRIKKKFFLEGNDKRQMIRELNRAIRDLQRGRDDRAFDRAEATLKQTNGCALRGRPDPLDGEDVGNEARDEIDLILRCRDQNRVYPALNAAVEVLR